MDNRSKPDDAAPASEAETPPVNPGQDKAQTDADHLYTLLKPLHNLPRGKNTWDPKFIKIWWFWPLSAVTIIVLFHVWPLIWDFFFGP